MPTKEEVEKVRSYLMSKGMTEEEFGRLIRDADERLMDQMRFVFPDFGKND